MLRKSALSLFILVMPFFIGCSQNRPQLKHQYMLSKDMVINESGCGYGTNVADEQLAASPMSVWNGQDKELCKQYKSSIIINLLQKISITDVYLYCSENSEAIISAPIDKPNGKPTNLNVGWNKITLNSTSSYLSISFTKGSKLSEVLVDAKEVYPEVKAKSSPDSKILMESFIGTNAFVDVPLGFLEPFGCVREYHDWPDWNEPQKDSFSLSISKHGFDFESFYVNLNKLGKTVVPTLQKSPKWLTGDLNAQCKPLSKGADPLKPASYVRHALYLQKYAQNFSPADKGNLHYFENWNEQDKWWEYGVSYFSPYQYASMSSADKDGDMGKMTSNIGMNRNGEKNKLVMAGIANPKTDYLHALKHWCDINRKGNFAWEVLNYHRYSNSAGLPDNQAKEGISPEMGNVYGEAKEIVSFRNKHLPGVEVWISEFGYDTENSPQQCKPIGNKSSELVQADWLIRSYVLLSAAGIDKAFQYMIRDFAKSGLYATSGLYSTSVREKPFIRPSWNYINTFKCALQNTYFERLEMDSTRNLYTAIYADKTNPALKTKVLWLGSQSGDSQVMDFRHSNSQQLINFSPTNACGDRKMINTNSLTISETPIIIQDVLAGKFKNCTTIKVISPTEISCKNLNGIPVLTLTDDQNESKDPMFGLAAQNPVSPWKTDYNSKGSNGIVFYLGSLKSIHSIQLFDGAGTGNISISVKSGGEWKLLRTLSMDLYNKWKTVVLDINVDEIKIEKTKGSPDVGEVLIYEKVKF